MKKVFYLLALIITPVMLVLFSQVNSVLASAAGDAIKDGASNAGGVSGGDAEKGLNDTITSIINIVTAIAGVIAVLMIVYGGFKYITSGGDSNKVSSAKSTIMYAIIGIAVIVLAQLIVRFVATNTKKNLGYQQNIAHRVAYDGELV